MASQAFEQRRERVEERHEIVSVDINALLLTVPTTLGRNEDNAIVLAHEGVSRKHAQISPDRDGNFFLSDLGSSNGTFLNDIRLRAEQRIRLKAGDRINLGPECEIHLTQNLVLPGIRPEAIEVRLEDLRRRRFSFLGRSDYCHVELNDDRVSKLHAIVERDGQGRLLLFDAGSRNGTFCNDSRVDSRAPCVLKHGDIIRVGSGSPIRVVGAQDLLPDAQAQSRQPLGDLLAFSGLRPEAPLAAHFKAAINKEGQNKEKLYSSICKTRRELAIELDKLGWSVSSFREGSPFLPTFDGNNQVVPEVVMGFLIYHQIPCPSSNEVYCIVSASELLGDVKGALNDKLWYADLGALRRASQNVSATEGTASLCLLKRHGLPFPVKKVARVGFGNYNPEGLMQVAISPKFDGTDSFEKLAKARKATVRESKRRR